MMILFYSSAPSGLPIALRSLYSEMSKTTDSVTPHVFLVALRQAFPQFAEQSRSASAKMMGGVAYAQQGIFVASQVSTYTYVFYRRGRVLGTNDKRVERRAGRTRTFCIFVECQVC